MYFIKKNHKKDSILKKYIYIYMKKNICAQKENNFYYTYIKNFKKKLVV